MDAATSSSVSFSGMRYDRAWRKFAMGRRRRKILIKSNSIEDRLNIYRVSLLKKEAILKDKDPDLRKLVLVQKVIDQTKFETLSDRAALMAAQDAKKLNPESKRSQKRRDSKRSTGLMSDVIEAEVVEGSTVTPSSSLQLKYKFNAGQPTLLNQEGKKVYGKDLLIAIRDSPLSWKMPDVKIKSLLLEERAVLIRKGHSQDFFKKVRGILNKLTPEKFETLVLQLKEQRINSLERLSGVVDLVFEKAVKEPSFSKCYADMCKMIGGIEVLDRVKVVTEDTNPRKPKQQQISGYTRSTGLMSDVIEAEVVEGSTVTPSSSLQLKYKFNAGQPTLLNQEGKKVYGKDLLIAIRDSPLSWKMPDVKIKSLLLEERAVLIRKGHSQDFFKKVRGILNKLTPEKFDTLVLQLKEQRINSLERLSGVVDLVFEKAVKEPSFSKCYADMCKMIGGIEVLDRVKVATEDTNPRKPKQQVVHFRQLLLRKCQYEFEKNKVAEFDAEKRMAEIKANKDEGKRKELKRMYEEDERKIRTRSVGLVSFIAELYKLKMLSPHIMHYCVKQLISKIDEESLECLCKLLMTIGKDLEKQSQEDEMHYRDWNYYFDKMAKLSAKHENSKVSSRIRFMLQDLIELRGNQWIPRHSEKRPLKFSEINKEVERETLLNNIEISANAPRSMCNRGQNNHWRNQRGGECQNEKGWQTVTSTSFGNCPFKVGKPQHMKNTQQKSVLGPMKEIKRLGCEAGMISTGCFDEGVTPTRKPTSLPSPNLTDARRSVSSRSGASDSPSRHHLGVKYPHSRSGIDVLPPSSALQQPSTSTWMPVAPPADPSAPVSELMPYNLKRRVEDILTILSTHNDVEHIGALVTLPLEYKYHGGLDSQDSREKGSRYSCSNSERAATAGGRETSRGNRQSPGLSRQYGVCRASSAKTVLSGSGSQRLPKPEPTWKSSIRADCKEEDNYQASKEDRKLGWKKVERRRDRREVQREDRKIPPPPPPSQPQSPQEKTNGGQGRERPKCWTCGSTRHLQPECPSLYRRDQGGRAYRLNPDPMEVNAVQHPKGTWIFQLRRQIPSYPSAASSRSSGSDGPSDDEWPLLPSARGKQPRQPVEKPAVSVAALRSTVPGGRGWVHRSENRIRDWVQSKVKLCTCVATTVAGPTPLSGELVLSLKGLLGKNRSVVAHMMDWASNEYDAILGTDTLGCVKGRLRKYDWIVRLGTTRYRSEGGVSHSGYVGAAVVKKMNHIRADNGTQHFKAVFHTKGEPRSATGRVRHEIVIPDDRVGYIKPMRYPQALMDVICQGLKDLLDQGIIRKSISPYCSPLWVVPKPPDSQGNLRHRVVMDYKELNKHTRSEKKYPLPRQEDMLDRMNGVSVFSILDLKAGYHQIRMHEAD
ncbi:hypothetical protein AAG570_008117 [Ranatra chinensis]|uniref:CCHC-type domain-containing protein n=1 Tax=Ranatra chinensis TaxID=642074 RepID=A0ABD0XTY1_9HEMI